MLWQLRSNKPCIIVFWIIGFFFFLFSVVVLFLLVVHLKLLRTLFNHTFYFLYILLHHSGFLWFCGLFSLIFAVVCFSHCSLLFWLFCNMWNIFLNFCLPLPSCSSLSLSPFVPSCSFVCLDAHHRSAPIRSCFGLRFRCFGFNWSTLFSVSSVHQVTFFVLCFLWTILLDCVCICSFFWV